MSRVARGVSLLLASLALVACAAMAPSTPEQAVGQRAKARWEALMAGDWRKAYGYMAPSFRSLVEEKRYANQFGGGAAWLAAEVVRVTCEKERCAVHMKVTFRPTLGVRPAEAATTYFDETWIREDGQWWMFQRI